MVAGGSEASANAPLSASSVIAFTIVCATCASAASMRLMITVRSVLRACRAANSVATSPHAALAVRATASLKDEVWWARHNRRVRDLNKNERGERESRRRRRNTDWRRWQGADLAGEGIAGHAQRHCENH